VSFTPSLRLRLIGLFVLTALVVAAVIIFAVERFSAAALMDLMMEGSDSPEEAQLMFDQYVGRVLLIGAGVAVVLGSLTGWWFLRRILRPLDRLADATHAVAAGDLDTRVPVPPDPELRSLAESFNRMTASLERAETLRRAVVEDVAHELRTPLTSLRGYTEALADGVVEPTPDMLRTVHEEIVRLTRLVEELDQLARGSHVQRAADRVALDLGALVARTLELASPELTRRSIRTDLQLEPGTPSVTVDPDGIGQVLANLLQNAARYTDHGGAVTVRIGTEADGVRCTVENTGAGIPAGELPLIWERLHRVDPSRSRGSGGAGIGLAIVRQIVEAHGGRVGAESADGRTAVWFWLPGRR
jgi:two-component system sensor histidine kinase BaeS